jgi:hypothetical protein
MPTVLVSANRGNLETRRSVSGLIAESAQIRTVIHRGTWWVYRTLMGGWVFPGWWLVTG